MAEGQRQQPRRVWAPTCSPVAGHRDALAELEYSDKHAWTGRVNVPRAHRRQDNLDAELEAFYDRGRGTRRAGPDPIRTTMPSNTSLDDRRTARCTSAWAGSNRCLVSALPLGVAALCSVNHSRPEGDLDAHRAVRCPTRQAALTRLRRASCPKNPPPSAYLKRMYKNTATVSPHPLWRGLCREFTARTRVSKRHLLPLLGS